MMMQHHHLSSMSESGNSNKDQSTENKFVVKRRSSEEQGGPGGKFKFKDSIRERFSHEFEAKAENATVTSDHFTGTTVNTAAKITSAGLGASASHQEFYTKRRRPSRSCDESGSEVNSIASHQSQVTSFGSDEKFSILMRETYKVVSNPGWERNDKFSIISREILNSNLFLVQILHFSHKR